MTNPLCPKTERERDQARRDAEGLRLLMRQVASHLRSSVARGVLPPREVLRLAERLEENKRQIDPVDVAGQRRCPCCGLVTERESVSPRGWQRCLEHGGFVGESCPACTSLAPEALREANK